MGEFISGLTFCTSHGTQVNFILQLKRSLQWLMRIFLSATIGFQVPVKHFGNGTVVWQCIVFTLALLWRLVAGFMVPNLTHMRRFKGTHLRNCLITSYSMAAEGEFAFVIAVFSVDGGLINTDAYTSIVHAVLLSINIPLFALQFTISYYNKRAEDRVDQLTQSERNKKRALDADTASSTPAPHRDDELIGEIRKARAISFAFRPSQSIAGV
jgi:Kef-type K+ transport system membrane component KefB